MKIDISIATKDTYYSDHNESLKGAMLRQHYMSSNLSSSN